MGTSRHRRIVSLAVIAVCTVSVAGGARPAHACDCGVEGALLEVLSPPAQDAPVDTKIWIRGSLPELDWCGFEYYGTVRVREVSTDALVPSSTSLHPDGLLLLSPESTLHSNVTYSVDELHVVQTDTGIQEQYISIWQFTTGDSVAQGALPPGVEVDGAVVDLNSSNGCDPSCDVKKTITLRAQHNGAVVVATQDPSPPSSLDAQPLPFFGYSYLFGGSAEELECESSSDCAAECFYRFGAFDAAGNFSGWSAPYDFGIVPQDPSGECCFECGPERDAWFASLDGGPGTLCDEDGGGATPGLDSGQVPLPGLDSGQFPSPGLDGGGPEAGSQPGLNGEDAGAPDASLVPESTTNTCGCQSTGGGAPLDILWLIALAVVPFVYRRGIRGGRP